MTEQKNELIDWSLYGAMVKHERQSQGFRTAADFAEAVYRRTRKSIKEDVICRIEANRQEPTAEQFMAINLALFHQIWPNDRPEISACLWKPWKDLNGSERLPDEIMNENLSELIRRLISERGATDGPLRLSDVPNWEQVKADYVGDGFGEFGYSGPFTTFVDGIQVKFYC